MTTLDRLPNEVLFGIASLLIKRHDIAAFSQANRHCYAIANPILWKREKKSERPGALHWAIEHGNMKVFKRALEAGVDPNRIACSHKAKALIDPRYKWWNYHNSYFDDPAWQYDPDSQSVDLDPTFVRHNQCNCFEGGCDEGIFSDCAWEPIHVAASKGRIDMIEILLEKGANINAFSWGYCLCRPHLPIEAFSEPRAVDEDELEDLHGGGWTPLHIAMCHGHVETAKFLLEKGASHIIYQGVDVIPHDMDDEEAELTGFYLTALHHAARFNMVELLEYIVDHKLQDELDCHGPYLGTPLFQAIWYGHWEGAVPWLLKKGANIDCRLRETNLTPLMMASYSRHFSDAVKLVDLGADVTTLAMHHYTILHLILGPGQTSHEDLEFVGIDPRDVVEDEVTEDEIINKFIAKGFPVDAREGLFGMTPLMVASANCNVGSMKTLISNGADVNALDYEGLSALGRVGEAAGSQAVRQICDAGKLLLDAGATIEDTVMDVTPLNIISARRCETLDSDEWENQHAAFARLLVERGADPNKKGVSRARPFTMALQNGNFPLASTLLDCGGRPEPNDITDVLAMAISGMHDHGRTAWVMDLDFDKLGIPRPSTEFLSELIREALDGQKWTRVADLITAVPELINDIREGLMHMCLLKGTLSGDDPSKLVQTLLDRGEDPNELWQGEPPIYYSLKSGYCWRSTPVLINAGANIHLKTTSMPDGAFIYSITQKYHSQSLQMIVKHPTTLIDLPERLHRMTWLHMMRDYPAFFDASPEPNPPHLYWSILFRMLSAGLRTDVVLDDDRHVKDIVQQAIPTDYPLGDVEQNVLKKLGIEYEPPVSAHTYPRSYDSYSDDDRTPPSDLYSGDDISDEEEPWADQLDDDGSYDDVFDDDEDEEDDDDLDLSPTDWITASGPMAMLYDFLM